MKHNESFVRGYIWLMSLFYRQHKQNLFVPQTRHLSNFVIIRDDREHLTVIAMIKAEYRCFWFHMPMLTMSIKATEIYKIKRYLNHWGFYETKTHYCQCRLWVMYHNGPHQVLLEGCHLYYLCCLRLSRLFFMFSPASGHVAHTVCII